MNRLKNMIIPILFILCVLSIIVMLAAISNAPKKEAEFIPPSFEFEAIKGIPEPPQELGWSELYQDGMNYRVGICGNILSYENIADIYLSNSSDNKVWLKLRVLDENNNIIGETGLLKPNEYNFDCSKEDNKAELRVVIESMLQHYGSSTRCMDFVDNHWIALWFGLYHWVATKNEIGMPAECFYKKRTLKLSRKDRLDSVTHIRNQVFKKLATIDTSSSESKKEVNQLIKNYSYKLAFAEDQYLYLLLFVADTLHETAQHSGIYSSSRMTVVDLRRALPSIFLRPGAQHGWTVKMNSNKENMSRGDYSFAKDIVAILRIPLSLADELIGGALLSQENLFPPEDYDQGYRILLQRQEQSIQEENPTDLDLTFKKMPILKYK